jgi:hypothetical protein
LLSESGIEPVDVLASKLPAEKSEARFE